MKGIEELFIPSCSRAMSFAEFVKFSWTRTLLTLICFLDICWIGLSLSLLATPAWLLGLSPVMKTEHDGEGAGRQQLLIVVTVQAVRCCQSKSVANLNG